MRLRTLQQIILYRYRLIVGIGLSALAAVVFGWWRLTSVARGFSSDELKSAVTSAGWHDWLQKPLAPITHLANWIVIKLWGLSLFGLRSVTVTIGIIALIFIGLSIRHWLGRTTAILISVIVLSSSWWLLQTRQATGSSELLLWLALTTYFIWKLYTTSDNRWWYGWCVSLVGISYNPGGLWILLVILLMVAIDGKFRDSLTRIKPAHKAIGIFVYIVGIAPILYLSLKHSDTMSAFLNIDSGLNIASYARNVLANAASIFVQLPSVNSSQGISNHYLIHYTQSALVVLGLLAVIRGYQYKGTPLKAAFRRAVIMLIICGLLISSLSQNRISDIYIIFPTILAMSAGLWLLMQSWNSVFPLNPYPRTFGFILIIGLVGLTAVTNYKVYFSIWADSPSTSKAFSSQIISQREALKGINSDECDIIIDKSEQYIAKLTKYSFGILNRRSACEPSVGWLPDPSDTKPQLISASKWRELDYYSQSSLLAESHYPVVNDRKQNSLEYWTILP